MLARDNDVQAVSEQLAERLKEITAPIDEVFEKELALLRDGTGRRDGRVSVLSVLEEVALLMPALALLNPKKLPEGEFIERRLLDIEAKRNVLTVELYRWLDTTEEKYMNALIGAIGKEKDEGLIIALNSLYREYEESLASLPEEKAGDKAQRISRLRGLSDWAMEWLKERPIGVEG